MGDQSNRESRKVLSSARVATAAALLTGVMRWRGVCGEKYDDPRAKERHSASPAPDGLSPTGR